MTTKNHGMPVMYDKTGTSHFINEAQSFKTLCGISIKTSYMGPHSELCPRCAQLLVAIGTTIGVNNANA